MRIRQSIKSTLFRAKRANVFLHIKITYIMNEMYYSYKHKLDNRSKLIRGHGLGIIQSGFIYDTVYSRKHAYRVENYKEQIWLLVNPFCMNSKTFRLLFC